MNSGLNDSFMRVITESQKLPGNRLQNDGFQLTLCKCVFLAAFHHFRAKHLKFVLGFFFRPWDFLDNMCLSQSCLRDYIIPIIPQCCLSRGKNCERRTDYTNETNLYGLLTQIIYGVGKSFCSHLFWMEFILSKKKGSSIPATTHTCERLIKS